MARYRRRNYRRYAGSAVRYIKTRSSGAWRKVRQQKKSTKIWMLVAGVAVVAGLFAPSIYTSLRQKFLNRA